MESMFINNVRAALDLRPFDNKSIGQSVYKSGHLARPDTL